MNLLLAAVLVALGLVLVLLILQFRKLSDLARKETDLAPVLNNLGAIEKGQEQVGRDSNGTPVWLPIDAKFPVEDYQRLVEASERGDADAFEKASRQLEATLKFCAKNLSDKYIAPPATTDFGILFLSTEGLYAEAMRRAGLAEFIQREYRIVLSGPSTLAALLNSFQMGFRTLAIQQRSSEVWELLGTVKSEFGKYADVLAKVKKKLTEAQNTIDKAETRTRANVGLPPHHQWAGTAGSVRRDDPGDGQDAAGRGDCHYPDRARRGTEFGPERSRGVAQATHQYPDRGAATGDPR